MGCLATPNSHESRELRICDELMLPLNVTQLCPTLCDPMDCIVHGILQARILEWVAFPFSRGPSQPRDGTQVSHIAGRFFISWATREAENTEVGSLSLLQQISPTQESNRGLLHCKWILYQLSYQGIPRYRDSIIINDFLLVTHGNLRKEVEVSRWCWPSGRSRRKWAHSKFDCFCSLCTNLKSTHDI